MGQISSLPFLLELRTNYHLNQAVFSLIYRKLVYHTALLKIDHFP